MSGSKYDIDAVLAQSEEDEREFDGGWNDPEPSANDKDWRDETAKYPGSLGGVTAIFKTDYTRDEAKDVYRNTLAQLAPIVSMTADDIISVADKFATAYINKWSKTDGSN